MFLISAYKLYDDVEICFQQILGKTFWTRGMNPKPEKPTLKDNTNNHAVSNEVHKRVQVQDNKLEDLTAEGVRQPDISSQVNNEKTGKFKKGYIYCINGKSLNILVKKERNPHSIHKTFNDGNLDFSDTLILLRTL